MNFYNTGNRFNFFNEEEEENTGGNIFKTMRTKKIEKEKEKLTDDERFKFKSSLDAPPKAKEFTMETSAFPVLAPPPPIIIRVEEKSFVGRLNKLQIVKVEQPPLPSNSHWVTITHNKKTGKWTYKEQGQGQGTVEQGTVEQETKKESKLIIKALTDLHIKRTNDFIKSWGQDEHYRTFYSTSLIN
jgi:hypothetical protein